MTISRQNRWFTSVLILFALYAAVGLGAAIWGHDVDSSWFWGCLVALTIVVTAANVWRNRLLDRRIAR